MPKGAAVARYALHRVARARRARCGVARLRAVRPRRRSSPCTCSRSSAGVAGAVRRRRDARAAPRPSDRRGRRRAGGSLRRRAGRLARENATAIPGARPSTASALMIGLALVTFVSVLAQGIRARVARRRAAAAASTAYVVSRRTAGDSLSPAIGHGDRAHDRRRRSSSSVRSDARSGSATSNIDVSGLDPATSRPFFHFTWVDGSNATRRDARERTGRSCASSSRRITTSRVGDAVHAIRHAGRQAREPRRARHPQAGRLDTLLGSVARLEARRRRALRAPAEHDGVRRARRTARRARARVGAEPLSRTCAEHRVEVRRRTRTRRIDKRC